MYTRDSNNSLVFDLYESLNSNIKLCKRELTNDPEHTRIHDCHRGIEAMYNQCREAATLGDAEDVDQSSWAIREVVFPPTRTTVISSRD